MTFTIVSTIWGDKYDSFVPGWLESVEAFEADEVIIATDKVRNFPYWVTEEVADFEGRFPAPFFLNRACMIARTDWIWLCDIDDRLRLGAKSVLGFDSDIVGLGYARTDGFCYIPDSYEPAEILKMSFNPIPAASPFRRHVWEANHYPDIGHQDWGFWRQAARAGFTFESSGIIGYDYTWHPESSISGSHDGNPEYIKEALAC